MASLSEQLKAVKLKKSEEPTKDYSSPKTAGFISEQEVTDYQEKVLDVNTEKWLDILQKHTFPTEYCSLYLQEAEMMVAIYERLYKNLDAPSIAEISWREKLSAEEADLVKKMEARLQEVIDKFVNPSSPTVPSSGGDSGSRLVKVKSDYVFVKTSSRSAKDAPMAQRNFKELYQQFLSQEPEEVRSSENTQITCLLKAAFQAMRVRTASEVMEMMMRSERIYQDMLLALEFKDKFHENFVVRAFVDIDVDMEFRGFVYDGSFVALSQYNYLICSQRLIKRKDEIQRKIQTFFQDVIKPKLDSSSFVKNFIIDFAIGSQDEKLWVIEINPFLVTTDAALFSWEHERHILEGSEGFQFRITTRPKPGAKTMLPHSVKSLLSG